MISGTRFDGREMSAHLPTTPDFEAGYRSCLVEDIQTDAQLLADHMEHVPMPLSDAERLVIKLVVSGLNKLLEVK